MNGYHRRQKIRGWLSLDRLAGLAGREPGPAEIVGQAETRRDLLWAVGRLDDREREIIALKFSAGLSNRAIAGMTGLTESHVAVILFRTVKRLRIYLAEYEVEP